MIVSFYIILTYSFNFSTCTYFENITTYTNKLYSKTLLQNEKVCIYFKSSGFDATYGTIAFHSWNNTKVCLHSTSNFIDFDSTCRDFDVKIGGASLGANQGIIEIFANKDSILNVGFTTFLPDCVYQKISSHNSDWGYLDSRTKVINCYYNSLPGILHYEVYANTTINQCSYSYSPFDTSIKYLYKGSWKLIIPESEQSILKYKCEYSYRRTKTNYYLTSSTKYEYYTEFFPSSYPSFYGSGNYWEDTLLVLMIIGAVFGVILIFLCSSMCFVYFKDKDDGIEFCTFVFCIHPDCCECCPDCCNSCQVNCLDCLKDTLGSNGCCCTCKKKVFSNEPNYNYYSSHVVPSVSPVLPQPSPIRSNEEEIKYLAQSKIDSDINYTPSNVNYKEQYDNSDHSSSSSSSSSKQKNINPQVNPYDD